MVTVDSPLVGPATGTLAQAEEVLTIDHAESDAWQYTRELFRLAPLVNLDPALLFAQAVHEVTDPATGLSFTSKWWRERTNPAGIGVTGDDAQNEASQTWWSGADAARGHVLHALAYVKVPGLAMAELATALNEDVNDIARYDQRVRKPFEAGYVGRVSTVGDLTGRWGRDPRYGEKVVAKHRAIFGAEGETPVAEGNITFGNVPYPAVTERHLPVSNKWVKEGAPAVPEAVVWHRMIGTLWGTDTWFFGDHAATAYGVGVITEDGADDAGRIIEWMSPESRYYGESSGPANAPYGDGAALIAKVGMAYNRVTKAIEISGRRYDVPLDEPARNAIVNLTAYWADQRKIPWYDFPMIRDQDRSFVVWHQEICGPQEKACPGSVVMNETPALIARVKAMLQKAQVGTVTPKPPVYAPSVLPPNWGEHIAASWPSTFDWGGMRFRAIRFRAEALKGVVRRSEPSPDAPKSGPNFQVREKGFIECVIPDGRDGKEWFVTNDGHYVRSSSFTSAFKPR